MSNNGFEYGSFNGRWPTPDSIKPKLRASCKKGSVAVQNRKFQRQLAMYIKCYEFLTGVEGINLELAGFQGHKGLSKDRWEEIRGLFNTKYPGMAKSIFRGESVEELGPGHNVRSEVGLCRIRLNKILDALDIKAPLDGTMTIKQKKSFAAINKINSTKATGEAEGNKVIDAEAEHTEAAEEAKAIKKVKIAKVNTIVKAATAAK